MRRVAFAPFVMIGSFALAGGMIVIPSYPPRRHVSFELDHFKYDATVVLPIATSAVRAAEYSTSSSGFDFHWRSMPYAIGLLPAP